MLRSFFLLNALCVMGLLSSHPVMAADSVVNGPAVQPSIVLPPAVPSPPLVLPPPLPVDPQRYNYPAPLPNGPVAGRPLSGYDHIPFTGYGPLAGFYPVPAYGYPPIGYAPPLPGPFVPHKGTLTTPPTDSNPRQKPLIKPLHQGKVIKHLRTGIDVLERAPEGCPEPLGCSNFYTEFKFIFGSCRDWFGTSEGTYGQFRHTYIIP